MPDIPVAKAAQNLIAELNSQSRGWHSVYIQNRVNNATGDVQPVLMVHLRPGHESKWRNRDKHFGYTVEVHPWPLEDMQ